MQTYIKTTGKQRRLDREADVVYTEHSNTGMGTIKTEKGTRPANRQERRKVYGGKKNKEIREAIFRDKVMPVNN